MLVPCVFPIEETHQNVHSSTYPAPWHASKWFAMFSVVCCKSEQCVYRIGVFKSQFWTNWNLNIRLHDEICPRACSSICQHIRLISLQFCSTVLVNLLTQVVMMMMVDYTLAQQSPLLLSPQNWIAAYISSYYFVISSFGIVTSCANGASKWWYESTCWLSVVTDLPLCLSTCG